MKRLSPRGRSLTENMLSTFSVSEFLSPSPKERLRKRKSLIFRPIGLVHSPQNGRTINYHPTVNTTKILCLYNSLGEAHFVSIVNLVNLLSHCSSSPHTSRSSFCWQCKHRFRGVRHKVNYDNHKAFCKKQMYGPGLIRTEAYRSLKLDEDQPDKTFCTNCFASWEGSDKQAREAHLANHLKVSGKICFLQLKLLKLLQHCTKNRPAIIKFPKEKYITFDAFCKRRYCPFTIYREN